MSTNYYLRTPDTPDGDEGIHLGQYAAGTFTFRAHPDRGVVDYDSWRAQMAAGVVYTEYGRPVTVIEMVDTAREQARRAPWVRCSTSFDGGFYDMEGRRWLTVDFF